MHIATHFFLIKLSLFFVFETCSFYVIFHFGMLIFWKNLFYKLDDCNLLSAVQILRCTSRFNRLL